MVREWSSPEGALAASVHGLMDAVSGLFESLGSPVAGSSLRARVEHLERQMLKSALVRHGGNKSRVAAELGLSRLGLRKKLKRYGIDAFPSARSGGRRARANGRASLARGSASRGGRPT
jgi:DNA-binding NtrC family response regulator